MPLDLRAIKERLRRPVPTRVPGGDATVNQWIEGWSADRRDLESALSEVESLRAEMEQARSMFDVTRHRVCERLRLDLGTSWFNVESAIGEREADRESLRALLREARGALESLAWNVVAASTVEGAPPMTNEMGQAVKRANETHARLASAIREEP